MGLGKKLLELLFPPKCAFCSRVMEDESRYGICERCAAELPYTAPAVRKCDFVKSVSVPLYYEDAVRRAILRFKFDDTPALSLAFGHLMAEKLREENREFDILTWVPISARRHRSRGYDQSRLLCEEIARELGTEVTPTLRKIRHIQPQSRLTTAEERRANISGCFALLPGAEVQGKRILLVDDILTTGATVSECARMLLLAGAGEVQAAALACRRERAPATSGKNT